MTYGSLDQLFKLMQDNGYPGVNTIPVAGTPFEWDDTFVFDEKIYISNSTSKVNYATAASSTGATYYNVQEPGYPAQPPQVVPPVVVVPDQPAHRDGYFYVYPDNPNISADGDGNFVYTDSRLLGLSNYSVYADQIPTFLHEGDITYNLVNGSFTIVIPGFYLVEGYRLTVFTNYIGNL
nr:hypothetical protein [Mucilaginibacter rubeus]